MMNELMWEIIALVLSMGLGVATIYSIRSRCLSAK